MIETDLPRVSQILDFNRDIADNPLTLIIAPTGAGKLFCGAVN